MNEHDPMSCNLCGSTQLNFTAKLSVTAPIHMFGRLTKKDIASKDVSLLAMDWSNARIVCRHCQNTMEIERRS